MNAFVRIGAVGVEEEDGSWLGLVFCIAAAMSDSKWEVCGVASGDVDVECECDIVSCPCEAQCTMKPVGRDSIHQFQFHSSLLWSQTRSGNISLHHQSNLGSEPLRTR